MHDAYNKVGAGPVRRCPQGLFRPFRLFRAPLSVPGSPRVVAALRIFFV